MMNKIQGIPKIIFVDFDNTLSANKWSAVVEETSFSQDDYVNWDCICKTNQNTYDKCEPVPCVQRAIHFFHERGSRIILLGWEDKHFAKKRKEQWVDFYFHGVFEDKIFTSTAEQKVKVMEVYSLTEGIDRSKIAIMEDRSATCYQADEDGFLAWTLSFMALVFDGNKTPCI